ncbi:hypothetical protein PR048_022479 [Dryococelus australis]|uniref:Secreted protein n=1 Tax=Dryococelus australis TaxID=614101 RepID=A0ABQ9H1D7_9NEOP|nr:hypothetical protein PR048_022479 [Dryococelus australis]
MKTAREVRILVWYNCCLCQTPILEYKLMHCYKVHHLLLTTQNSCVTFVKTQNVFGQKALDAPVEHWDLILLPVVCRPFGPVLHTVGDNSLR